MKKLIGLDIETHDPELKTKGPGYRRGSYVLGIAIAYQCGNSYESEYMPLRHLGKNLDRVYVKDRLATLCNKRVIVGANILYDMAFLLHEKLITEVPKKLVDVLGHEAILQSPCSLNEALMRHGLQQKKIDTLPVAIDELAYTAAEQVAPYATWDAEAPLHLLKVQTKLLADGGLMEIARLENDLLPVILKMHMHGVRIDKQRLMQARDKLAQQLKSITEDLGWVNPSSSMHIGAKALSLGIDVPRNKSGKFTIRKSWLENHTHPFLQTVNKARDIQKTISTYLDGIPSLAVNDRIYPIFHPLPRDQHGVVTGRISSSRPNIQAMPARDEVNKALIRGAFIPDEDEHMWIKADYSQIEYRVFANLIKGELLDTYLRDAGTDYHAMCQQLIYDKSGRTISRWYAKVINFGVLYGMGNKKLCEFLQLSEEEGSKVLKAYHTSLPHVKKAMVYYTRLAAKSGEARTFMGRRRYFNQWEVSDFSNKNDRRLFSTFQEALQYGNERHIRPRRAFVHKAINTIIQGSAADIMKYAMVKLDEAGFYESYCPPLITVHDELGFSVPREETKEAASILREVMCKAPYLSVPLAVDIGIASNWGEAD